MDIPIGIRRVVLSALARFHMSPSPKLSLPVGTPEALKTLKQWFKGNAACVLLSFPCIRANTAIGVGICLLIYAVPARAGEVQELVAVQVGVFTVPANAERVAATLDQAGFPVITQPITNKEGRELIRVMAGPYATQKLALSARDALRTHGLTGTIRAYEPTGLLPRPSTDVTPTVATPSASPEQVTLSVLDKKYQDTFDAMVVDLSSPERSFEFVRAAVEVGDMRGAIAALERILLINPSLANIKLELGVLYLRVGSPELAETYIEQALAAPDVPESVRARAEHLLGRASAGTSRHRFGGRLFFAGREESNANAAPASQLVKLQGLDAFLRDEDTERRDTSVLAVGAFEHRYRLPAQAGHEFETDLLFYNARYDESEEIDTNLIDLELGPRFYLGKAREPGLSLRPFISASYLELESERYLRTAGGGLNLRKFLSANLLGEATLELDDQDFSNSTRRPTASNQSGDLASFRGELRYQVGPRTLVTGRIRLAQNSADEDFESFDEAGLTLSVTQRYKAWSWALSASVRETEYDEPDPVVDPNTRRDDTRDDLTFSANFSFAKKAAIVLTLQRTENDSNLPNNEFDNDSASIGTAWRF